MGQPQRSLSENWGALIGLMGLLLICGAFVEECRVIAICIAGASKVIFIALVLSLGRPFLQFDVGVAIVVDIVVVAVLAAYLIAEAVSSRSAA